TLADQLGTAFINTPSSWPQILTTASVSLPNQTLLSAVQNPISLEFSFYVQDETVATYISNNLNKLGLPIKTEVSYNSKNRIVRVRSHFSTKSEIFANKDTILNKISSIPGIYYREFIDGKLHSIVTFPQDEPNDTNWNDPYNWGIKKIKAREAWSRSSAALGHDEVVVAVIDTGYIFHKDLPTESELWTNPGESGTAKYRKIINNESSTRVIDSCIKLTDSEKTQSQYLPGGSKDASQNACDDDDNAIIDDVHGANFCGTDLGGYATKEISDYFFNDNGQGHGMKVASIIAAKVNNGLGIAGVTPRVKIMPIKILNCPLSNIQFCWNGNCTSYKIGYADISKALQYVIDKNADVINGSFGADLDNIVHSSIINTYISKANQMKINNQVFVVASGNDGTNIRKSSSAIYPAALDSVITVGAINVQDTRAPFSNYGIDLDVVAPGENILTACGVNGFYNNFCSGNGTSFAAPYVTGAVAILKSQGKYRNRVASWDEIYNALILNAKNNTPSLSRRDDYLGHGIINLETLVTEPINYLLQINNYFLLDFDTIGLNTTLLDSDTILRPHNINNVGYDTIGFETTNATFCPIRTFTDTTVSPNRLAVEAIVAANNLRTLTQELKCDITKNLRTTINGIPSYATEIFSIYLNNKVDNDGDGLIEIQSLNKLNLGKSDAINDNYLYYVSRMSNQLIRNTNGCPSGICSGFELSDNLFIDKSLNPNIQILSNYNSVFEGNYFTIRLINNQSYPVFANDDSYYGLFLATSQSAEIRNLRVDYNSTINFNNYENGNQLVLAGPVVARNRGTIKNVRTTGSINWTFTNSISNAAVPKVFVGGIVGSNEGGSFCDKDSNGNCINFTSDEISVSFVSINITANYKNSADTPQIFAGGIAGRDSDHTIGTLAQYTKYSLEQYNNFMSPNPKSLADAPISSLNSFATLASDGVVNYDNIENMMGVATDSQYKCREITGISSKWRSWKNWNRWLYTARDQCDNDHGWRVTDWRSRPGTAYIWLQTDKLVLKTPIISDRNKIKVTSSCLDSTCLRDANNGGNKSGVLDQPKYRGIQINSIIGYNCSERDSDDTSKDYWISQYPNPLRLGFEPTLNIRITNARPVLANIVTTYCK
ncbi:MAG: S8 family serine peptidase, partial [Methylacidiphilales bacterium]|nr:S8 family serine peptidase [Candidatus Methylacidiphilales bacterium]